MTIIVNESNLTAMLARPQMPFNETGELTLTLVNGNGTLNAGYISTYARIEGMDLVLQLLIILTVLVAVIMILTVMYVFLYYWRYVYDR